MLKTLETQVRHLCISYFCQGEALHEQAGDESCKKPLGLSQI
ncbi:hypothetical protein [Nostoc sp.]